MKRILWLIAIAAHAAEPDLLPAPQYFEPQAGALEFRADSVRVEVAQPHLAPALELMAKAQPDLTFITQGTGPSIVLWDYSANPEPKPPLNALDRWILEDSRLRGQSYVIRVADQDVWVIGGGFEGVLYGAATVTQMFRRTDRGVELPAAYVRDWPDFEYRAASDWLLHVEVNRWSYDRGQGLEAYGRLLRQRIDRAARFKINMALADGFGWSLESRGPGYAELMRSLNRHARKFGVHLMYGGYGAAYDSAQHSGEYQGTLFYNRQSYPNGSIYQCLKFPQTRVNIDPSTMGSCRGNDDLNRLKGEDLARFVDVIEPGGLYIHHEDCCVFEDFQKAWLGRCERCRRRWPNDSLLAADGGAGALAHGYSSLIGAINRVQHAETGFQAARDTQIVLVSPVYMPATARSDDWGQVLELWRNIARLLPRTKNVQICFREILPQAGGGQHWIEIFETAMRRENLPFGAFVFVVGGADNFLSDYALSGIPAMNAHFLGARSIYNAMGDFYREPMELLAAQYSWNARAEGFFRDPLKEAEMKGIERWIYEPGEPPEIFGPSRLFDRICARLYGEAAGREMSAYYRERVWLPEGSPPQIAPDRPYYQGRRALYVPRTWNYLTAIPSYWNHLLLDSLTWQAEPTERYQAWMQGFSLDTKELHRRLARRWQLSVELNTRGGRRIQAALSASPSRDAVTDLEFLASLFRAYQPLLEAIRDYHAVRAGQSDRVLLQGARKNARAAGELAERLFPQPVDPALGEIRSLRHYARKLAEVIQSEMRPQ